VRAIESPLAALISGDYVDVPFERGTGKAKRKESLDAPTPENAEKLIARMRNDMKKAAAKLDFERAAELRDRIRALEKSILEMRV
jgi:excinuclease ABC subunit B